MEYRGGFRVSGLGIRAQMDHRGGFRASGLGIRV